MSKLLDTRITEFVDILNPKRKLNRIYIATSGYAGYACLIEMPGGGTIDTEVFNMSGVEFVPKEPKYRADLHKFAIHFKGYDTTITIEAYGLSIEDGTFQLIVPKNEFDDLLKIVREYNTDTRTSVYKETPDKIDYMLRMYKILNTLYYGDADEVWEDLGYI